jgi:hypothetical protein
VCRRHVPPSSAFRVRTGTPTYDARNASLKVRRSRSFLACAYALNGLRIVRPRIAFHLADSGCRETYSQPGDQMPRSSHRRRIIDSDRRLGVLGRATRPKANERCKGGEPSRVPRVPRDEHVQFPRRYRREFI